MRENIECGRYADFFHIPAPVSVRAIEALPQTTSAMQEFLQEQHTNVCRSLERTVASRREMQLWKIGTRDILSVSDMWAFVGYINALFRDRGRGFSMLCELLQDPEVILLFFFLVGFSFVDVYCNTRG